MAAFNQAPNVIAKAESMNSVQAASPDMNNTGPREQYGQSGGFQAGGHQAQTNVHAADHKAFALGHTASTTPITNAEYQRIGANAQQGCPVCAAFVAGVKRTQKSQQYWKAQQPTGKPGARPYTEATAGNAGPGARAALPTSYTAMAGSTPVTRAASAGRSQGLSKAAVTRAARIKAADRARARKSAGDRAAAEVFQRPNEDIRQFLQRQAVARGHAENAVTRMLGGK